MEAHILVAEDEARLRTIIRDYFTAHGLTCALAKDGEEALERLRERDYDAVLLDVLMPNLDGFAVCRAVREGSGVPILFLTALGGEKDVLRGYALGADDYVTKPFSLAVLRARVNNLLRRAHSRRTVLELPPFTFDFQEMTYTRNGVPLELSRTEQRLLRLLAEHRGQTLPRARLLEQVWDGGEFVDENALSVAVNRLRAKLTDAPIRTVYGVGYVWAVEPWRSRFCSSPSSRPRGASCSACTTGGAPEGRRTGWTGCCPRPLTTAFWRSPSTSPFPPPWRPGWPAS